MMRALAIQNYGSSGTTFVHSLLDNHPQVLQLPGLRGGEFYNLWRRATGNPHCTVTPDFLRTLVLDYFSALSEPDQVGDGWGLRELGQHRDKHPCVPKDTLVALFDQYLTRFSTELGIAEEFRPEDLPLHRKAHLCAIYHAYEGALGRDMSAKQLIVYPIHSAVKQDLIDLRDDFEAVFILHMIRNPINNLNSVFKYYLRVRTLDDPTHDIFSSALHAMFLDRALNISPERSTERLHGIYYYDDSVRSISRAVRLEDLHRSPETVMRHVAAWVGLRWDAVLLESTFGGFRWWNRPGLSRVSGFSPGIVGKETETYTSAFDEDRLAFIARPILEMYYRDVGHRTRRLGRRALSALGCLLPLSVEIFWRSPVRALIMLARHVKDVVPSYAAALEEDALREYGAKKVQFDASYHVLMPAASAAGGDAERPAEADAAIVDRPCPAGRGIKTFARGYSSVVDYVRYRWLIAKAIRFVRANRHRQVPLLFEWPHATMSENHGLLASGCLVTKEKS